MKKTFLFLLFLLPTMAYLNAQTCVRDSSIYQTTAWLAPAPWTQENMAYNLAQGCIGQPYSQSITFNVPDQYEGFPFSNIRMSVNNAIVDLPTGITYSCDPPDCVFLANTLGCVLLHGTPDETNVAPDTLNIQFMVYFLSPFGELFALFPLDSDEYRIILQPVPCQSSAADQPNASTEDRVNVYPNPATESVLVDTPASSITRYEIFDLSGMPIQQVNQIGKEINIGHLKPGAYILKIHHKNGSIIMKIMKM